MATAGFTGRRASLLISTGSSTSLSELGEVRNFTLSASLGVADATSIDSNGWVESVEGTRSWTMGSEMIYLSSEVDQKKLRKALIGNVTCLWKLIPSTSKTAYFQGSGWVSSWGVSGAHDNTVLTNVTVTGTAALTYST